MLTPVQFSFVKVFCNDPIPDTHVFGYMEITVGTSEQPATVSINSAEESTPDYFINGNQMCGQEYTNVRKIELTKTSASGNCHLLIDTKIK